MNRKKRGLALLLCICMLFTLMPMAAFADGTSADVVYGSYTDDKWTQDASMTADSSAENYTNTTTGANVKYSKTAESKGNDLYDITLKIESETNPGAAATVLVIDNSKSMGKCATCNNGSDLTVPNNGYTHAKNCKTGNEGSVSLKNDSRFAKAIAAAKSFASSYAASGSNRYLAVVFFAESADPLNFADNSDKKRWDELEYKFWLDVSNAANLATFNNKLSSSLASYTNLASGLSEAEDLFKLSDVGIVNDDYKFTVALTDGANTAGGGLGVSDDEAAKKAATSLKKATNSNNLYAVCYSAGQIVFNFLQNDITGSSDRTFNADDTNALDAAFDTIVNNIKSGLSSGFTVTDPMGSMVTLQDSSRPDCRISSNGTITWEPTTSTTRVVDGKTIYTYTLTYTVKLNTEANGFQNNTYYPTNGDTTLSFVDGTGNDKNKTLHFNVPGVKGVKPTYTVTYQYDSTAPDGAALPDPSNVPVQKDAEHTVATPTAVPGWTFNGWKTSNVTGSETTYVGGNKFNMPNNNVTLTGSWTERSDLSYTVECYWIGSTSTKIGGSDPVNGQVFGTTVKVDETSAPTITGYTLIPYSAKNADGTANIQNPCVTIGTGNNVIKLYYYKNVKLVANDGACLDTDLPYEVETFNVYNIDDTAISGLDSSKFTGVSASGTAAVGATSADVKLYYDNTELTNTNVAAKKILDTIGHYIVTEVQNGKITVTPTYAVTYKYVDSNGDEITSLNGTTLTAPTEGRHQANDKFNVADYTSVPGYMFSGWTYGGNTYATNAQFTMPGNAVEFVGTFTPQSGLSYTVNYYWNGDSTKPFHTETGTASYGDTITAPALSTDLAAQYTIVPDQNTELEIASVESNVLDLYYYKNVVLEANSATYAYDGNLKTVETFKSYLATDATKTDLGLTFVDLHAYGEGTDVNTDPGYPVQFMIGGNERVPATSLSGRTDSTMCYYVTEAFEGVLKITGTYKVSYMFAGDVPTSMVGKEPATSGWLSPSDPYTVLPIPSAVAGYTFVGWTTSDVTGTEQTYVGANTFNMPENDVVLVGTWTHDKYTVSYEYAPGAPTNAPKVPDAKDYYYDAVVTVEDKPTLDGWIFTGWTVKNDDGTSKTYKGGDTFNMPEGNVILVGSWEKIPYTPPVDTGIYTKITVKITGNSASEVYDGTEKSVEGYTVEISDPRYTEKDFKFTGTAEAKGTFVGEYPMGLEADQFVNINRRFKNVEFIIVEDGVLTITARPITITAGSAEGWVTDCPITCDEWTSTPPAPGDTVVSVKITGVQNGPGSSPNVPSDAVIKNEAGKDVTGNYDITYVNGLLVAKDLLEKEDHFNYVIGYPDGSVQPNGNITRAEVATIFYRLLTDEARAKYTTTDNSFSDIKAGEWYTKAIATLENANIIGGYPDGTFKPNAPITRAEMATIIAKFANLDENGKSFNDIKGHWAQSYVELAAGNGWINGYEDGTFRPDKNITRAETFAMINRVLDRQVESVDDLLPTSQMNMWSDNLDPTQWYYKDVQEATNYHKCDRVNESKYETWTEKVPDIDWAKIQY